MFVAQGLDRAHNRRKDPDWIASADARPRIVFRACVAIENARYRRRGPQACSAEVGAVGGARRRRF